MPQPCTRRTGPTVQEVDSAITGSIPLGSEVSNVLGFLDSQTFGSRKFGRDGYVTDPEIISALSKYTTDEKAIELKGTLKGYIAASIPNVSHDLFNTSAIIATFYFDRNDRLIDYTVKEVLGK